MTDDFEKILDECIDRMNRGESLDSCLADYPDYAGQLQPLLQAMLASKQAYSFTPSPEIKRANRERFNAALESLVRQREARKQKFAWLQGWSRVWVTAAAVLIIAVISYFGIRPVLTPGEITLEPGLDGITPSLQPSQTVAVISPQPSPEGNFAFLISDDVNAIEDFESVMVTIAKIGIQQGGESGQWIEFNPEVEMVDLTLLPEDKAQVIWRGNVPEGQYTKVFIHVTSVQGILKETEQTVEVELPSQKLQISKAFDVSTDTVTSFVYDLTVVEAGKSGKYILQPQVGQSGADQRFEEIDKKD